SVALIFIRHFSPSIRRSGLPIRRFNSSFRRSRLSILHFGSSFRRSGFYPSL
ncbi:hypothetical protein ACVWXS_002981, partial [Lysinibacillus sp. TE18511]